MMTKLSIIGAAAATPMVVVNLAGAATNLMTNGDFSAGLNGWTIADGSANVTAAVENGEAVVTNKYAGSGNSYYGITQCVPVEAGETYAIHGDANVPADAPAEAFAGIYVLFFTGTDCQTSGLGGFHGVTGKDEAMRGSWQAIDYETDAPSGAKSALLRVLSVKEQAAVDSEPAVIRFDNISLAAAEEPTPTPTATVTSTPGGGEPTTTPTATPTEASTQPSPTPLPPSTGTGMAQQAPVAPVLGLAALIAAMAATAAGAVLRRRR